MADESSTTAATIPTTALSVVLTRQKHNAVMIAVAAEIPRKRTHEHDKVQSTIQHFSFEDDKRNFAHLDALLTRLAPLSAVYLACTEKAEITSKKNAPSAAAERKVQEVQKLLEKVAHLISTRPDLTTNGADNANNDLVKVYPSVPPLTSLESTLEHLLTETSYLAYRGSDVAVAPDQLVPKALMLLLDGQGKATAGASHQHSCELNQGVLSSALWLDRTASDTIHLLPPPHAGAASVVGGNVHNNSLFGILNQCKTSTGSRLLQVWLRQPLVDLDNILARQAAVTTLVQDSLSRDRLRDEGLAGCASVDLDALAAQLAVHGANNNNMVMGSTTTALQALYRLYLLVTQQLVVLSEALNDVAVNGENGSLLQEYKQGLAQVLQQLQLSKSLAETVLDLDRASQGDFLVKSSFEPRLGELEQELNQVDVELEECHDEMNAAWEQVSGQKNQVRLDVSSKTEWSFRLPNSNDIKMLQSQMNGITVHRLLKNGVYFSNKQLKELENQKQTLLDEYEQRQGEIVQKCMAAASSYTPVVERVSCLVANLDVLASLAHVAAYSPHGYCRPEMTDSDEDGCGIELKEARHPCVELQESVDFIPNDISLVFGESSFLLVTGPNMGGKSTYIRSLGAIVTMAQIGSYVPCSSAKINIVHHILARVGAGDAQDRGISTFMAEMLEASSILSKATKRSLIIIDELGRGTSTFDGYGLASAISTHIIEKLGCMTVFATHFHELTALEQEHRQVQNCHVTATTTEVGLTFLYEVRPGPCLESFGIQVAEMAHVPRAVIQDAKRRAKELEKFEYRSKRRKVSAEQDVDESSSDEQDRDEVAAALEFIHKFRSLPIKSFGTDEEKRQALRGLLQQASS